MAAMAHVKVSVYMSRSREEEVEKKGRIEKVMELNLLSLSSVRAFAAAWEARQGALHVLINNAGIFSMSAPQKFSEDGLEDHMQVNHLAPALLTLLLLPSLSRGAPSRVVNVNSNQYTLPSPFNKLSGDADFDVRYLDGALDDRAVICRLAGSPPH
ncbi:hypothetical protein L7F22_032517 [Adiantum nelumboides]|nr:hypothetical protein [Adiantum nelumboides]